ncbi:RadC family protein [Aridibaculum aurantiacum]|uniref:RadC family protein n=1 Tax=Aridibaculum aurantiacum TaxID=2810307 RepID=UPI001A96457B|nr:DNA repair protein RadC [Aridibaculum aurantiacum]
MSSTIKQWAEDDRPREKLLAKGADALTNSELIAILLQNGTVQKSAVDLAKELLQAAGNNLQRLGSLSVKDMVNMKIKGLGPAKAVSVAAALQLGIRRAMEENKKDCVTSSRDVANFLKAHIEYKKHEVFTVLYLNKASKINHYETISEGGISGTIADPRIILKKALEHNATSIILCHNHPSGSLRPSRQDEELTYKIKTAATYFDIKVLDHIIVSEEGFYSFADEGIL